MGVCTFRPGVKVKAQSPPEFAFVRTLVKDEKCIYGLMEKKGLKNLFLGKDDFQIKQLNSDECIAKINQPTFDMVADRIELGEPEGKSIYGVSRRANMSSRDTFYIYTLERPYPEAEPSNESCGGQQLYCWGFLSRSGGFSSTERLSIARYFWDPERSVEKGKDHPYKQLYVMRTYGCNRGGSIIFMVDEKGEVVKDEEGQEVAICQASLEAGVFDKANMYSVEIAAGVDTGLMLLCMAIRDEMNEPIEEGAMSAFVKELAGGVAISILLRACGGT